MLGRRRGPLAVVAALVVLAAACSGSGSGSSGGDGPDVTAPGVPADFDAAALSTTSVRVSWTATADGAGPATLWELRFSENGITQATFKDATFVAMGAPLAPGQLHTVDVPGLAAGTTYDFALRIADAAGNASYAFTAASTAACPDGYAGAACTECAEGYVAGEDGACVYSQFASQGALLITEVMRNGGTDWFEIQNVSDGPVSLAFVAVEAQAAEASAADGFALGDAVLAAGERAVFAAGPIEGVTAFTESWPAEFALPDAGAIRLTMFGGVLDELIFGDLLNNPGKAVQLSSAVVVYDPEYDARSPRWYWCEATAVIAETTELGTPGAENGNCGVEPQGSVDWCRVQSPASFTAAALVQETEIFARVYEPWVTDRNPAGNDGYPHLVAQLGYGVPDTNPDGWTWVTAEPNAAYAPGSSNDDEVSASVAFAEPGTYWYGYRFALRDPTTGSESPYTYCNLSDVVAEADLDTATGWGQATITAPP